MTRPAAAASPHAVAAASAHDEACVLAAAQMFALLADPTRLRMLLELLVRGDADVGALADTCRCRPSTASQHLAKLRISGVVTRRREGQRVVYQLSDGGLIDLLSRVGVDAQGDTRELPRAASKTSRQPQRASGGGRAAAASSTSRTGERNQDLVRRTTHRRHS